MNLGGISNISFEREGRVWAFDICPFNLLLNYFANKLGESYDADGNFAKEGKVNTEILNQLNQFEYLTKMAPKSLGREQIERLYFELIGQHKLVERDWLRTLIEHYVICVANVFNHFSIQKVLITGGGALKPMVDEESEEEPTQEEIEASKALLAEFEEEKALVENERGPRNRVDNEQLWEKAKRASKMALGRVDWAFVMWWYLRHGGQKIAADYETKEVPTQPLPDAPLVGSDNVLIQTAQTSIPKP